MNGTRFDQGQAKSLAITALLSAVLFYSGFFTFLFAVPVQYSYTRHGGHRGVLATISAGVLILAVHLFRVVRISSAVGAPEFVVLDVLMPLGMLAGLAVFNVARQYPWWLRLLGGGAVALIAAFPSLRVIALLGQGNGELTEQFNSMLNVMGVEHNHEIWVQLVRRIVLSSIGLALTAGIAANWWLGTGIARRSDGAVLTLRRARVPDRLVWMVIGGLAVVVATWITGAGRFAPVGWNFLLVGGFLFAIQGIGLIQHLLHLRGVGAYGERWVLTLVLVGLFIPGVNVLVAGALPLLGISELWIDYRRGERYEGNTE